MSSRLRIAGGVLLLCAFTSLADISVVWSSLSPGGFYANGSTWSAGPWLREDAFVQLVWSPIDPVAGGLAPQANTVAHLDASGAEFLLLSYGVQEYQSTIYGQWPLVASPIFDDGDVGGNTINEGYVYTRVFQNGSVTGGAWFYQSPAIGSNLPQYDPLHLDSFIFHDATGGSPREFDRRVDGMGGAIPEPATGMLALIGLAALVIRSRRTAFS